MRKVKILILCAAGMSSGLIVDSIKEHAAAMDVDVDVHCAPSLRYRECDYEGLDVLLFAPQVRSQADEIRKYVEELHENVPAMVIAMRDYGLIRGESILKQALQVIDAQ